MSYLSVNPRRLQAVFAVAVACLLTSGSVYSPEKRQAKASVRSNKDLLRSLLRRSDTCKSRGRSQCCDHPMGLVVTCIDYRIQLHELLGEDIGHFDMVRLPGAALTDEVVESIGLAIEAHRVRLVLVLEHTDCAMDRLAAQKDQPGLARLQWHRRHFEAAFTALARSANLRGRISRGELLLIRAKYDVVSNGIVLTEVMGDTGGLEDVIRVAKARDR